MDFSWLGSVTVSCLLTTTAQAEWYFGGYGGISKPGALSNATVSDATLGGGVTNAKVNDLELKAGLLEGVKGIIVLSRALGWEWKQRCTCGNQT